MLRAIAGVVGITTLAACLFAVAVVSRPDSAGAGEATDAAARAESLLADGKAREALDAFDSATDAFWSALPLTFRTVLFAERVDSYGVHAARADARFRAGETALVYLEPAGFGWSPESDGFKTKMETDLEIRSTGGLILGKAETFAKIERMSRVRSRELSVTIRLPLPPLKAGDYELLVTVRDLVSGKSATASLPFTLIE